MKAAVGYASNPLVPMRPIDMRVAPVGEPIASTAPQGAGVLVCRLNGEWLLRESWGRPVFPGDVVEWYELPQDKDDLRGALQLAALVVAIINPMGYGAYIALGLSIASSVLLPMEGPAQREERKTSPTYSTSLSANEARLYEAIPKICGRHQVYPPYAGRPYYEYDENGDQYLYALLVVGEGNHIIERKLVDDTDLNHFQDVLVSTYLAPSVQPALVQANVVTAPEVTGQNMLTARYIGGFAACRPKFTATHIGIDVIAPRGLGLADSGGTIGDITVTWRVEVRALNEFGVATTPWEIIATETRTVADSKTQRWSVKYELDAPIRPEVRIVRTDVRNDSIRALHDIQWAGLRAYLAQAATLNAHTAHLEIVMRASEQLSGITQSRISVIAQAMCRTWHPDTGWSAEVPTRNPAWWIADLASSPTWGLGLTDERIDLQTLYELSLVWEARQDRFDYVFDSRMGAWDALQIIARAGRARVFRPSGGVLSVARDQVEDLPVTAFTARNAQPASMVTSEVLPEVDTPIDGVIVEYFDNRQWDWLPIECPGPGVVSMNNPIRVRLPGVTGAKQAEREGLYEAASLMWRPRTATCTTEMQGVLPAYMSPVRWQPETPGYGQTGDVAFWDAEELVMGLSEKPIWGAETLYITLIRDDGSLTDPVAVSPGPTEWDVVLPAVPDFVLVLDDGTRERPKFLLGGLTTGDELVKVTRISDGGRSEAGEQLYKIEGLIDDDRVHEVDNHLLPGPGVIQDPVDGGAEVETGPDILLLVVLNDHSFKKQQMTGTHELINVYSTIQLLNDGRLRRDPANVPDYIPGVPADWYEHTAAEWIFTSPVEVSEAGLFEVYVELLDGELTTGTLDTWLPLDTTRTWTVSRVGEGSGFGVTRALLRFSIRLASTEVIQDVAIIELEAAAIFSFGGS